MLRLAGSALAHPRLWLALLLALTAAFAAQLPRLELRTDGAAIYPAGNPVVALSEQDRQRFQDPEQVILLASATAGGGRLDGAAGLRALAATHAAVAALPGVRGDAVVSLASRLDPGAGGRAWGGALDAQPQDEAAAAGLVRRLQADPLTGGLLLSRDGRHAALYVPLEAGTDRRRMLRDLDAWVAQRAGDGLELRLLGPLVAEARLGDVVLRDLARLVPGMVAVIAVLLGLTLRSPAGVLLPLAEALLVLVWTLGLMAVCGSPVTLVTTILPVVLMSMAITDEIHLLERVQARVAGAGQPVRDAMLEAVRDVRGPIVATSVTTALGFASFCSASLPPLRAFGLFTGFGIAAAMLLSFTLVPALGAVLPPAWFRPRGVRAAAGLPVETRLGRRGGAALAVGLLLVLASLPGLRRLEVQDSWVDNFDRRSTLARAERDFNAAFWGSYRYDLVVEGPSGFFLQPEGAALVQRLEAHLGRAPHVAGVLAYRAALERTALALGETRPLGAMSAGMLSELALVAQMAQDRTGVLQLVTTAGDAVRLRLFVPSSNYRRARQLHEWLQAELPAVLDGRAWHASGDLPVALEVVHAIVDSQMRSIGWSVAGIAALLLVALRRPLVVAVALVPVSVSALLLFGAMGWAGVPLGIATSMFASLSIGVGIDFALHLLHGYGEARRAGRPHAAALESTLARNARAIRWNTVVLCLGLLVLVLSALRPDRSLGVLLAGAVLGCWVTTLLFLPQLLRLLRFAPRAAAAAQPAAAILALAAACLLTPAAAGAGDEASAAERTMQAIERDFRRLPRAVRMHVSTHLIDKRSTDRTLWGLVDGDRRTTRILYVFTAPEALAGMTLLVHDAAEAATADSAWIYLPSFERLSRLDAQSQRLMVPGTALTQEDARGFIPCDRYDFAAAERAAPAPSRWIEARPAVRPDAPPVAYGGLELQVDAQRRLVERVEFMNAAGKLIKTYELLEPVRVGDVWLPRRVRVRDLVTGFTSEIEYAYWPLERRPEPDVFTAGISESLFLPRLDAVLRRAGIGRD